MQYLLWFIGVLAGAYLLIIIVLYFMQSSMIYYPQQNLTATPAAIGLDYEEVTFQTSDEVQIHGWFVPSETAELTVLYFHGNAGNISGRLETLDLLNNLGLNVLIIDYRGYGKSGGVPSEKGTYKDAEAAWQYLTEERATSADKIVIMGRSLGGAIGAQLASNKEAAAAIIESTFTSAEDLGADFYPWLPVRWVLKHEYPTIDYIRRIRVPLMIVHSRDDNLIPFHHGRALYEAANKPKVFVELTGSHNTGFLDTGVRYQTEIQNFLKAHTAYPQ